MKGRRCQRVIRTRGKLIIDLFAYYMLCCRVEWKVNEVADSEATTFSIFYNNALFLFLYLLLAYLCRGFHPAAYPSTMIYLLFYCVLCVCVTCAYMYVCTYIDVTFLGWHFPHYHTTIWYWQYPWYQCDVTLGYQYEPPSVHMVELYVWYQW